MLVTPQGSRYVNSYEQVMLVQSGARLIKLLRSKAFAESCNFHYEGPEIVGDGVFGKMSLKEQIVALYLTFKNLGDHYHVAPQAEWKNSALECVYSWIFHEIAQELNNPNSTLARTNVARTYQHQIDGNRMINTNSNNLELWADIVDKLAANAVYTSADWEKHFGNKEKEELLITDELLNVASSYFDDAETTCHFPATSSS